MCVEGQSELKEDARRGGGHMGATGVVPTELLGVDDGHQHPGGAVGLVTNPAEAEVFSGAELVKVQVGRSQSGERLVVRFSLEVNDLESDGLFNRVDSVSPSVFVFNRELWWCGPMMAVFGDANPSDHGAQYRCCYQQ